MFKELDPEIRQDANVGILISRLLRKHGVSDDRELIVRDGVVHITTRTMADAGIVERLRGDIGDLCGPDYTYVHSLPPLIAGPHS